MVYNLYVCFGKWKMKGGWKFEVDCKLRGRMVAVEIETGVKELVKMICEEFDVEEEESIEIAYSLAELVGGKMPKDTPPVCITKDSQLKIFLNMMKSEVGRLCVSKRDGVVLSSGMSNTPQGNYLASDGDDHIDNVDSDDHIDNVDSDDHVDNADGDDHIDSAGDDDHIDNEGCREIGGSNCTGVVYEIEKVGSSSGGRELTVGEIFDSKKHIINHLRRLTIVLNFDFDITRSSKELLLVKCFVEGCSWMIRATCISTTTPEFMVRKVVDEHTCSATVRYSRHRQATAKCIGRLYLEKFGGSGQLKGIVPRNVIDTMKAVYGIQFEYKKAHMALSYARELIRGSWEDGYNDLPTYLHMLKKANPGTITRLESDEENKFKYLFFAFSACVIGFQFLRPVVVVDGTHLNGKFRGVLLVAAGQDANSNIFPLAFGIVDSENDESWEWFFLQLRVVVANARGLVFISDRHRSISKGIAKIFPTAHRGICTYHLGQNLKSRFRGTTILNLFKKASKVARVSEFDALFEVIRQQNSGLAEYLERADIKQWSRAHFPGYRYNIMTSNICESINAVLKEAREFPIACLIEHVRRMIVRWFRERREAARLLEGQFSAEVERKLLDRAALAARLTVQPVDYTRSHVIGGSYDCMVDLNEGTCTCRMYEMEKIPCEHAIAAAGHRKIDVATLVNLCYSKGYLFATYSEALNPLNVELPAPPEVASGKCLPPTVKVPVGRPKKKRYESPLEKVKKERKYLCSQCKHDGHNRKTCPIIN